MPRYALLVPIKPAIHAARNWRDWVGLAARLVLGGVLLVAGAMKVGNLERSVLDVRAYKLVPYELLRVVGYGLPLLEIALGLALLVGLFTRIAASAGTVLMAVFIAGIASVWARGLSIDCGCFGNGGEIDAAKTQYPAEIARDVGLAALGLWLAIRPRTPWAIDNWLFRPAEIEALVDGETEQTSVATTQTEKEPA